MKRCWRCCRTDGTKPEGASWPHFANIVLMSAFVEPFLNAMKFLLSPAVLLSSASLVWAVDFKRDIQPILKAQCYKCHSEEADKEKGGYVFDNLERLAKDIGPGRVIEPGKVGDSHFFFTLVSDVDDDAHMPPNKMLADKDIQKIREWIEAGAVIDGAPMAEKSGGLPPQEAAPVMQAWTNTDGKTIQAAMLRLEGEAVVLRMANGQIYNYPLEKLAPESQEQARKAGMP